MFDVDNLLGYNTNAYQLIQHVVAACFYLNFSHTNVNGLATPLDGAIQQGGFVCYNDSIDTGASPSTVQAGDVIGACVFDPEDSDNFGRRQLAIVGEIDGESLVGMSSSGCTTDALPLNIPVSQLSAISSRRLYLYANIGIKIRSIIMAIRFLC